MVQFIQDLCFKVLYFGNHVPLPSVAGSNAKFARMAEFGWCRLARKNDQCFLQVNEHLPIAAAAAYFKDVHWLQDLLAKQINPSSLGFMWEVCVPTFIKASIEAKTFFSSLGGAAPVNVSLVENAVHTVSQATADYTLANFIINPNATFFVADTMAGTDLYFVLLTQETAESAQLRVPCSVQIKLKNVIDNQAKAWATTDLSFQYARKDGVDMARREAVVTALGNNNTSFDKACVRVLIAYPAKVTSKKLKSEVLTVGRHDAKRKEYRLVFDCDNAMALFPRDHLQIIDTMKGRVQSAIDTMDT